jgi:hypothetical protein
MDSRMSELVKDLHSDMTDAEFERRKAELLATLDE